MISIVITTHGEGRDLPGILSSLECQRQYRTGTSTKGHPYNYEAGPRFTEPKIEVIISCDGNFEGSTHSEAWTYWGDDYIELDSVPIRCRLVESPKAEPSCCGHNTRAPGINAAKGDWIVLTNSDNFFFHGWYHSVVEQLEDPNVGLVYWNIVSNLWAWQARKSKLFWGDIDLSCVCVKADIAKAVGFPWRHYDADWNYVEECVTICSREKKRTVHIDQVLGVHN